MKILINTQNNKQFELVLSESFSLSATQRPNVTNVTIREMLTDSSGKVSPEIQTLKESSETGITELAVYDDAKELTVFDSKGMIPIDHFYRRTIDKYGASDDVTIVFKRGD